MELTIPQLNYPEGGGYASIKLPETRYALWDEFLLDNAKANLAKNVKEKLTQVVNCSIKAGPVAMPEKRGIVERFFETLEENGYHRLPSTNGSNINDPRRHNPEKNAIKYHIILEHLEELTEVLLVTYNETPHEGINNFTPLEVMEQRLKRGLLPRKMPETEQKDTIFLSLYAQRTVRGSIKTAKRPYIYYEGVSYRNEVLSKNLQLIGTKLDLLVNTDDIRVIKAFLPDGSE